MMSVLAKSTSSHTNLIVDVNTYILQKCTVHAAVSISCRCKGQLSTKNCFVTLQIQTSTNDYIGTIAFGREQVIEFLPCFNLKKLYRRN